MTDFQQVLNAALALSPDERGRLVDQLLGELPEPEAPAELSDAVKRELDRRVADMDAHPDDEISLEDVKAEVLEELRRCRRE
jgi:putative addiction module component (TIGR02574 family)